MEKLNNANFIGPGIWFIIHREALYSDLNKNDNFINFIYRTCEFFPCEECCIHCKKYLEKNSPINFYKKVIKYKNIDYNTGLLYWSWKFHNYVNRKLKKKIIPFNKVYDYYYNVIYGEKCDDVCSLSE